MTTVETFDILKLTDEARNVVLDALASEEQGEGLALWVEVTGTRGAGYSYDLYFSGPPAATNGGERLRGSRLEFATEGGGGLVLVNPNVPTPEEMNPGVPPAILALGLEGPLAIFAIGVLDQHVNPSIASHGGHADLVALDE